MLGAGTAIRLPDPAGALSCKEDEAVGGMTGVAACTAVGGGGGAALDDPLADGPGVTMGV